LALEVSQKALEQINLREAAEAQAQAERDRAERLSARLRALGLSEQ
jgi:hypothetical protein